MERIEKLRGGPIKLGVGGQAEYASVEDAFKVVAGYAFGQKPVRFKTKRPIYGEPLTARAQRMWAYRTYDLIRPSPGPELSNLDINIINGLNARAREATFNSIYAVKTEVDAALLALEHSKGILPFWELDQDQVTSNAAEAENSQGYWMGRAWFVLSSSPEVDVAVTHKLLHHKRPSLFPLIDNQTEGYLGRNPWLQIHRDLADNRVDFLELETRFREESANRNEVALTLLRLHDILLWCWVKGQADQARKAWENVVKNHYVKPSSRNVPGGNAG